MRAQEKEGPRRRLAPTEAQTGEPHRQSRPSLGSGQGGLPPWREAVFVPERLQRLVLGLVLARPALWPDLRVGLAHFDSSRATLYRVLAAMWAEGARDFPLDEVARRATAAGLGATFAHDLVAEAAPVGRMIPEGDWRVGLLEWALRLVQRRRRVDVVGLTLMRAAREGSLADLDAAIINARAQLATFTTAGVIDETDS